ncbi:MAG TPA: hypothetical protein VI408_07715 [Gaiellaceae bacterium]
MTLDAVRDAIDTCGEVDTAAFARRTRNAIALAIVARGDADPTRRRPSDALRAELGDELAALLASVYEGNSGWTSSAIDALEPLNELARRQWSPS